MLFSVVCCDNQINLCYFSQSVFSSLKNWWSTPKQTNDDGKATSPTSPNAENPSAVTANPNLGPAYERSQMSVSTLKPSTHPGE